MTKGVRTSTGLRARGLVLPWGDSHFPAGGWEDPCEWEDHFVPTFSGMLAIALASGVNLYATVLTLGLCIRFGWISGMPPELSVLAHPAILMIAGIMYVAEFIADKVPFFTPFWDGVHTFIRPLGAAVLAAQASAHFDPLIRTAAVLLSGSLALAVHSTKMSGRLAAHAVPDPVTHSAISIGEDAGVVGLLVLAWTHPLVALPVCLVLVVVVVVLLRLLYRTLRKIPDGFSRRFKTRRHPDDAVRMDQTL